MLNMKRPLCPVDLSEASQHALEQAIVVAGWFESRLTVQHAPVKSSCRSHRSLCRATAPIPWWARTIGDGFLDDVTAFAAPARELGSTPTLS
jgi:nucleotide-binding universal stress UspA family protein